MEPPRESNGDLPVIEDIAKQRFRVRAAWNARWKLVKPEAGAVTAAVAWRTMVPYCPPGQAPTPFKTVGPQRVTWLGYDPQQGLVHADAAWDPHTETSPQPPLAGWRVCDIGFCRWMAPDKAQAGNRYFFDQLPSPEHLLRNRGIPLAMVRQEQLSLQHLPFVRLIDALRLPLEVMRSMFETDTPLDNRGLPLRSDPRTFQTALWLAGNNPASGCTAHQAHQRRVQAVQALPCFSRQIMVEAALSQAVDQGLELIPRVAEHLGCSPSTVRILAATSIRNNLASSHLMHGWMRNRNLIRALDAMPRDTLRSYSEALTIDQWTELSNMAVLISYSVPDEALSFLGSRLHPDQLASAASPLRNVTSWRHLRDVADEMARDLVWPAQAALGGEINRCEESINLGTDLAAMALASLGPVRLPAVLEAHMTGALRRAEEVSAAGEDEEATWPIPAEPVFARDGEIVRFLSSAAELAWEGSQMQHCVANYSQACQDGRCAIMSIGRWVYDEWEPSSTVELGRREDGEIEVVQHQGRGNRDPAQRDVRVLEEWMSGLHTGETLFDHTVLPAQGRSANIDRVHGSLWNTREAAEARWDRWRRILDVRSRTAGDFLFGGVDAVQGLARKRDQRPASENSHARTLASLVGAYDTQLGLREVECQVPALPGPGLG